MKNTIITVLSMVLVLDFICFVAWATSGQIPQDGFYFGMITKNIINLIINI